MEKKEHNQMQSGRKLQKVFGDQQRQCADKCRKMVRGTAAEVGEVGMELGATLACGQWVTLRIIWSR